MRREKREERKKGGRGGAGREQKTNKQTKTHTHTHTEGEEKEKGERENDPTPQRKERKKKQNRCQVLWCLRAVVVCLCAGQRRPARQHTGRKKCTQKKHIRGLCATFPSPFFCVVVVVFLFYKFSEIFQKDQKKKEKGEKKKKRGSEASGRGDGWRVGGGVWVESSLVRWGQRSDDQKKRTGSSGDLQ
eukprot:TRINITY_DN9703_c3_g1_i1.p2 TRINITY_DN9703_c3_g1~~TRINITY_DN9703_c3_g1_i1.p2  ORF type:complete len:188 (+),score=11.92 TRINITY_DN9703_c3_g1_i1:62-625(+)